MISTDWLQQNSRYITFSPNVCKRVRCTVLHSVGRGVKQITVLIERKKGCEICVDKSNFESVVEATHVYCVHFGDL